MLRACRPERVEVRVIDQMHSHHHQRAVALMAGVLALRGAQKADLYEPSRFIRTNERQAAPLT
jgi:hypothetical protein